MLKSFHIQNYALIDTLDISFEKGFSVITGETGAGKSIILGAIGLLLGGRADSKAIKSGASRCIIEGHFELGVYGMEEYFKENDLEYDDGTCILRRELSTTGKSRAFINDVPTSLGQMKDLGEQLIDIHSQHQNLLLGKESFQLNVVDTIAGNTSELSIYRNLYNQYRSLERELEQVKKEAEKSRSDEDYIRFQLERISEVNLKAGEQEELELEADRLNHAEEIKSHLYETTSCFNPDEGMGVLSSLKEANRLLREIMQVFPKSEEWQSRIENCHIELKDIADEIETSLDEVEFNPNRLEFVNERLDTIYSLQQKYHLQTGEELLAFAEELKERLTDITSFDERIELLTRQKEEAYANVLKQADILSKKRLESAKQIELQLKEHLIPLGMPNVQFSIDIAKRNEPDSNGMDVVTFLFSANKNGVLQNIANVASGGEVARVMLSIKALISGVVKLPTIIFDEIDTGVSGKIAERMAMIMQEMGKYERQVISITHLPQIAASGETHYRVYKTDTGEGTSSHICRLTDEERINEIAHMLSGETITDAAINNAKELLKKR